MTADTFHCECCDYFRSNFCAHLGIPVKNDDQCDGYTCKAIYLGENHE